MGCITTEHMKEGYIPSPHITNLREQGQLPGVGDKVQLDAPREPQFDITISEDPARRLQDVIDKAGYKSPADFIVKALDVFEYSLNSNGEIVVEDPKVNKRYVFDITNTQARKDSSR